MTTPESNLDRGPAAGLMILLGMSYPVLAHLAVVSGRAGLVAASIGLLALLVLLPGLRHRRPLAWTTLPVAALGIVAAVESGHALLLLFLPPILINGFMAWLFGHTLLPGRTPLIVRVVHAMHGPDATDVTAEVLAYARQVTQVWAGLFVVLTTVNILLAAFARPGGLLASAGLDPGLSVPLGVWSLFANLLNYVVVAAMFVIEFAVRRRRFPQAPYRGLVDFTRRLAALKKLFRPAGHD
jgi:uncharacterized membrane protein